MRPVESMAILLIRDAGPVVFDADSVIPATIIDYDVEV